MTANSDSGRSWVRAAYKALPFKQPLLTAVRAAIRPPESIYRHLHFTGVVTIPIDSSHSFKIRNFGYQVENDLFWAGYGNGFEGTSLRLWARLARSANVILDIGANTGIYALAANAINPAACVYAFEPIARIAERLADNIKLNSYETEVVIAGASAETGTSIIYEPDTEHAYSASLNPDMLGGTAGLLKTQIAVTRIDDFSRSRALARIDLVKIDAEKYEIEVLTGFGDLIARDRPAMLIEILDRAMGLQVAKFFDGLGYQFYEIDEGHGLTLTQTLGACAGNHLLCPSDFLALHSLGAGISHGALELG